MSSASSTIDHSHVAHHFDSAQQQFDAGKLGMWLFLVTEVLFFSGLFVAYAVYRANHPEVFLDAHRYLNTTLGALNTIVLLLSSLTMAWAVRCAQLGDNKKLITLLAITLGCASFFLGVKAVEYSHKWNEGLLWAGAYAHEAEGDHHASHSSAPLMVLSLPAALALSSALAGFLWCRKKNSQVGSKFWFYLTVTAAAYFAGLGIGYATEHLTKAETHAAAESHGTHAESPAASSAESAELTGVFFSIYYAMTGVHAIHILAGMGVIAWLLLRAIRNEFGPQYYGPVDYVGLYWHVVDLVWIYLFPLLYLIR